MRADLESSTKNACFDTLKILHAIWVAFSFFSLSGHASEYTTASLQRTIQPSERQRNSDN
jgi:hypothetical protein